MKSLTNGPILIYDDKCSSCAIFAKYAFKCSRGYINCVGHYSKGGENLRKLIFPPNYNETEMFWIITANHAYGGRNGLLPLLGLIIKTIFKPKKFDNHNFGEHCSDNQMCNHKKLLIKRLYNLLRHGKKLDIKYTAAIND